MLMRNEEIELVLLRSIVERGENCQQAAEAVSRYLWSVPAPAAEESPKIPVQDAKPPPYYDGLTGSANLPTGANSKPELDAHPGTTVHSLPIDKHNLILENEKLRLENWQLKGALGYPVPGHIPLSTEYRCGFCDARSTK